MESSSGDEFVILLCKNPNPIEPDTKHNEVLISTTDIHSWDLSTILRYQTVRIQAHRNRLVEQSSYFHGLLSGSFSESKRDCVLIQWNLEIFVNVLKFIHGFPVDLKSNNFLALFEAALYFGTETVLLKCKDWFSEAALSKGPGLPEIQLDDLINIWNFGLEHVNDFVPELCASYLARNFMWAMSNNLFGNIPYNLLLCCIKHPHLTIYSEMHLSEALLVWLNVSKEQLEPRSKVEDDCADILKQIRISLLPLWFAAGKRRSEHFSNFADESIEAIFRLMKMPATGFIDVFGDGDSDHLRIRLTEYSKKVNLSGCPQITSANLLLSLLPSSYNMDQTLRKNMKESFVNLGYLSRNQTGISQGLLPTLSFEAVEEVDISRCSRLHLEATIECFSKSFPSLRTLKAAYLLNFRTTTLCKLLHKCPLINEVDLTVDIIPIMPAHVSVLSSSPAVVPPVSNASVIVGDNSLDMKSYYSGPSFSNVTKLTLEGRSDIRDSDLQYIANFCVSLHYLNLKGCISVTDVGISNIFCKCVKLHSILVCDTSFGINSILALCSASTNFGASSASDFGKRHPNTLASKLKTLHMGGCKGVDERSLLELISQTQALKSLCLRDTHLIDDALYSFSGSLLETLDVSNTMISGAALACVVIANPALKCLNARGCKNLMQQESNTNREECSSSYSCRELWTELGKKCILEEISLGWGFSCFSLEDLKPAIMSLRAITVGLGGSLGEDALTLLPTTCPMLEEIILYFQVISDRILINIMASLRHLQVLALCYCLGDIATSSLQLPMPSLRKLRLDRVTSWMTNNDLVILTQSCANLIELSLLGCKLLNSDSLRIISHGWPGLISIHLEECGEVTANGVSSLFNCRALEDLLLRHNGPGVHRSFILEAASKMPMLRKVSLDFCDACEGDLDIPNYADRHFLSTVKIARCKFQRSSSNIELLEAHRRLVHKETLVLVWNSEYLIRTVVKERL